MNRFLALLVIIAGVVCLALGGFFIYQGIYQQNWLVSNIEQEQITLGLTQEEIDAGKVLEGMNDLLTAGDTIRGHRKSMAPTYNDALGGQQFDPTVPLQAKYAQAMNLENYLYLGVLSFGVVQVVEGTGAFMIVVGIALGAIGIILWRICRSREYLA